MQATEGQLWTWAAGAGCSALSILTRGGSPCHMNRCTKPLDANVGRCGLQWWMCHTGLCSTIGQPGLTLAYWILGSKRRDGQTSQPTGRPTAPKVSPAGLPETCDRRAAGLQTRWCNKGLAMTIISVPMVELVEATTEDFALQNDRDQHPPTHLMMMPVATPTPPAPVLSRVPQMEAGSAKVPLARQGHAAHDDLDILSPCLPSLLST